MLILQVRRLKPQRGCPDLAKVTCSSCTALPIGLLGIPRLAPLPRTPHGPSHPTPRHGHAVKPDRQSQEELSAPRCCTSWQAWGPCVPPTTCEHKAAPPSKGLRLESGLSGHCLSSRGQDVLHQLARGLRRQAGPQTGRSLSSCLRNQIS